MADIYGWLVNGQLFFKSFDEAELYCAENGLYPKEHMLPIDEDEAKDFLVTK